MSFSSKDINMTDEEQHPLVPASDRTSRDAPPYDYEHALGSYTYPTSYSPGDSIPVSPVHGASAREGEQRTMLYVFKPTHSVPGSVERVISVMGRTRRETIQIARSLFDRLDKYEDERLLLEVYRAVVGVRMVNGEVHDEGAATGKGNTLDSGPGVGSKGAGTGTGTGDVQMGQTQSAPRPDDQVHVGARVRNDDWSRVSDDVWPTLLRFPPAKVRITVRPSEADKRAERLLPLYIISGTLVGLTCFGLLAWLIVVILNYFDG